MWRHTAEAPKGQEKVSVSGQGVVSLMAHQSAVQSLAFTYDGRRLLSGAVDGQVLVWDVASAKPVDRLPGSAASVLSLDCDAQNGTAIGHSNGTARYVREGVGGLSKSVTLGGFVRGVALSGNGLMAAVGSSSARVYALPELRLVRDLNHAEGSLLAALLSADGAFAAVISDREMVVTSLRSAEGVAARHRWKGEAVCSAADPETFRTAVGLDNGTVRIYLSPALKKGRQIILRPVGSEGVTALAWQTPDVLAVGSALGRVVLVSVERGRTLRTLEPGCGSVSTIRFSRGGGTMAVAGTDQSVRILQMSGTGKT